VSVFETQRAWICDNVLSSLPGADSAQVQRVYVRKTDEFLAEASVWIDEAIFTSDEYGNIKLDFSFIQAQMVWIHSILFENAALRHITTVSPARRNTRASTPKFYSNTPYPDVIVVFPRPNDGTTISVLARCALKMDDCSQADKVIPDWIFTRYKETIRSGVLAEMMSETGKAYSNASGATTHRSDYIRGTAKGRDEAKRGFGYHEAEWAYPGGFLV
jgi:hypothetical protein